jgi:hypothetical protein
MRSARSSCPRTRSRTLAAEKLPRRAHVMCPDGSLELARLVTVHPDGQISVDGAED